MQQSETDRKQARRDRRGNVLILALAVLTVLAVLAASYVTVSRLDRVSASNYARRTGLERQHEVVIERIGALMTADLFGNKIVTDATPRTATLNGRSVRVWPDMFEDGETWDHPSVDEIDPDLATNAATPYTFDDSDQQPGTMPTNNAMLGRAGGSLDPAVTALGRFPAAPPDDAWLASTEPVDASAGVTEALGAYAGEWDSWPQITNLRSAYEWSEDVNGDGQPGDVGWVRQDGRFVDLGRFFTSAESVNERRGDPGADLLDRRENAPTFYEPGPDGEPIVAQDKNSAALGVEQREVFAFQMNMLHEWSFGDVNRGNRDTLPGSGVPYEFKEADERYWADTDGDGRPDARWTQVDELNGFGGFVWVVAARVVDNSAMVNVNTATDFYGAGQTPAQQYVGDGVTPMDVDLYRLLAESNPITTDTASSIGPTGGLTMAHPDVIALTRQHTNAAFNAHLARGLGVEEFVVGLDQHFVDENATVLTPGGPLPAAGAEQRLLDRLGWVVGQYDQAAPDPIDLSGDALAGGRRTLRRAQREAYWRLHASDPRGGTFPGTRRYDFGEETDLRASWGSNFASVLSQVERRIDGPVETTGASNLNRLPVPDDEGDSWPEEDQSLGLMRSEEGADAVSTFELQSIERPAFGGGTMDLTQADKIERIQKDLRRHLTTVSGAAPLSPVPNLGRKPGEETAELKPRVNLIWDPNRGDTDQVVRELFDSLVWALAPLATNRPVMGALADGWDQATGYQQYLESPDYHYGGGPNGPARAWAQDEFGIGTAAQIGPAYALYRAASLAVNIADAVDNDSTSGGGPATDEPETPTVLRLHRELGFDPAGAEGVRPIPGENQVTLRTRQGDVSPPPLIDPQPNNTSLQVDPANILPAQFGVSFVGLESQPFIAEVVAIATYQKEGSLSPGGTEIVVESADAAGSVVAVELANPWNETLDLTDYRITLASQGGAGAANPIEIVPAGGVIDSGGRLTVVWHNFQSGNGEIRFIDGGLDVTLEGVITSVADNTRDILYVEEGPGYADGAVPWEGDNATWTVLLARENVPEGTSGRALVDRLTPADDTFPQSLDDTTGSYVIDVVDFVGDATESETSLFGARVAVVSSARRQKGKGGTTGGFPGWVIERPDANETFEILPNIGDGSVNAWRVTDGPPATNILEDLALGGSPVTGIGEPDADSDAERANVIDYPSFQLFVPNGPLYAPAELGMISQFAHTYVNPSTAPIAVTADDADPAASPWTTVSEELGKDYHLLYDATGDASTMPPDNAYLGVLDPTRFMLNTPGGAPGARLMNVPTPGEVEDLPDAMALPLALRVFDAIEVLAESIDQELVPGRVNINTAPKRVLATLPMLMPLDPLTGQPYAPAFSGGVFDVNAAYARLNAILQYRDRLGQNWTQNADLEQQWTNYDYQTSDQLISTATEFDGLRIAERYSPTGGQTPPMGQDQHRKGTGFVSLGELALLGEWTAAGAGPPTPAAAALNQGFLELGADMMDNTLSSAPREPNTLDLRRPTEDATAGYEPVDDPEERMTLFRAVSNTASTRSDVYTAWFVIRAYDPREIEAIEAPEGLGPRERIELLNELRPAFSERWLVVLDRSKVDSPLDRPRIILKARLEPTGAGE